MYIELDGDTPKELWDNLLDLVCYACECKSKNDSVWSTMVSKSDTGLIKIVDKGKGNTSGNQYHKDAEIKRLKSMIYDARVAYDDTSNTLQNAAERIYSILTREAL